MFDWYVTMTKTETDRQKLIHSMSLKSDRKKEGKTLWRWETMSQRRRRTNTADLCVCQGSKRDTALSFRDIQGHRSTMRSDMDRSVTKIPNSYHNSNSEEVKGKMWTESFYCIMQKFTWIWQIFHQLIKSIIVDNTFVLNHKFRKF